LPTEASKYLYYISLTNASGIRLSFSTKYYNHCSGVHNDSSIWV